MAGKVMIIRKECASCAHNTMSEWDSEVGCAQGVGERQLCLDSVTPYKLWESTVVAQPENSGAHATYYCITIHRPKSGGAAYMAECQDIIEALGMDFNAGNAFKALWRRAAGRLGNVKKGNEDPLYDAQKIQFYGNRILEQEENK